MSKEELAELKKELSKLSGVDMHNPKFRNVFKKYLSGEEKGVEESEETEEGTIPEIESTNTEDTTEAVEETSDDVSEDKNENLEENASAEDIKEVESEAETEDATEDNTDQVQESVKEKTAEELALERHGIEVSEDLPEEVPSEEEIVPTNPHDELLDTRLELELVRAGVRDDRIDVAKRLFLPELKNGKSIEEIRQQISQYPEWVSKNKIDYGMSIGNSDNLTAEERRLKQMGINPRD